jgi:energy-coupling factor transporter ATP-binding protein EcfA2
MHGADGCGKSTIASVLNNRLLKEGEETLLIGSSDFRQWLTADVYREFLGSSNTLREGMSSRATPDQKTKLYEDIAVCLFGLSERFAANRGTVIVHSDPYLKRLVWARHSMTADQFAEYAAYFDGRVTSYIGNIYASHLIDLRADANETFVRINERGMVSEYDPATEDENNRLHEAVKYIGRLVMSADGVFPRFAGLKSRISNNSTCLPEMMLSHTESIASEIEAFIREEV